MKLRQVKKNITKNCLTNMWGNSYKNSVRRICDGRNSIPGYYNNINLGMCCYKLDCWLATYELETLHRLTGMSIKNIKRALAPYKKRDYLIKTFCLWQ